MAKQQQREKLQLEIAARERAEKKQQEYEERLRNMAEEMDRRQAELNEAQEMIRRLEEQLKQLQAAKEELENRQKVSLFNLDVKKKNQSLSSQTGHHKHEPSLSSLTMNECCFYSLSLSLSNLHNSVNWVCVCYATFFCDCNCVACDRN